jgi:hypothetical protein
LHRAFLTWILAALAVTGTLALTYEVGHLQGYREGKAIRKAITADLGYCMHSLYEAKESFAACHDFASRLKRLPGSKQRLVSVKPQPVCVNCGGE